MPDMDGSINQKWARHYAKFGLRVFPCHYIRDDGRCSCGKADCDSPGKHPITRDGCLSATDDDDKVVQWWSTNPSANIGVATGPESGAWVLDLDGAAGIADLDLLVAEHGELPEGPTTITGGGGRHHWFAYPADRTINNGSRFHGKPIDVRGAGGYALVSPSNHASGTAYRWESGIEESLPAAPQWLFDWLDSGRSNGKPATSTNGNGKFVMTGDLDGPGVGQGERHARLIEFVGRHLAAGEAGTVVLQKAIGWGERCDPPIEEAEVVRHVTDIEQRHRAQPTAETSGKPDPAAKEKKAQRSQSALLVDLCAGAELFHDTEGTAYATIEVAGHFETWPIRSRSFKQWAARRYWQEHNCTPGGQAVADALAVLEGCAVHDGDEEQVYLRVADAADAESQRIVLDLAAPDWSVVVIDSYGWRIERQSPVKFRRTKGMRPLPVPVEGGDFDLLQSLLNVRYEDFPLVAAWAVAAMRPTGPYPVLNLIGEAGTGKSTTTRTLRSTVDPNEAPLRRQPRSEHDLVIAAHNSHIVTLDNLSSIPVWLSDAICRLATGGGFSTRTLYEDAEETLFNASRPVIINGIEELATRGDLVDRCVSVQLEPIGDRFRLPEKEYAANVQRHAPAILGALLTATSTAIRRLPAIRVEKLPRMADFALWSIAAEPALGIGDGVFLDTYERSRKTANDLVIEACLVGGAIAKLLDQKGAWAGTAAELLADITPFVPEERRKRKDSGWPEEVRSLGNRLRRIAPNLRLAGIEVEFSRQGRARVISLRLEPGRKTTSLTSSTSQPQKPAEKQAVTDDDVGDVPPETSSDNVTMTSPAACEIPQENAAGDINDVNDVSLQPNSNPTPRTRFTF